MAIKSRVDITTLPEAVIEVVKNSPSLSGSITYEQF